MPLGARYDAYNKPEDRFTTQQAKEHADAAAQNRTVAGHQGFVGMVVDLTNSNRYYDNNQWAELGLEYSKVRPCTASGTFVQKRAASPPCTTHLA